MGTEAELEKLRTGTELASITAGPGAMGPHQGRVSEKVLAL